ncbi:MAG: TerB family tellurite resistance protein [Acidobacteria bacterium]|nr:TerB family tellurite resistance protein [Acidobacteriota bacterium]
MSGFFGLWKRSETPAASRSETETVRKIVEALDRMEPDQARYTAAFAFILCRAARADLDIGDAEARAMERIVMERGGLPEEQAILVVQMAKTQNILFGGTEDFLVTREFNKIATREQKLALLDCLFSVSSADQSISTVEDNEISRICNELLLSRQDFIAARSAYRPYLAVLKKPTAPGEDA